MFSGLKNGKYPCLTPFVNSNLFMEHCLQANYGMYKMICHILREQANGVEVSYHATSVKLMQVHLWREISTQHVLYLLGGLAVIPAWFCGTDAHNKVKHILLVASLNKCFHDLAKEHKVPPMVIECMNCKFACHKGNPNLPFDAKECDIKIALRMENKMGHTFFPDMMYYGSHLVMVAPMNHDGSSNEWVVNHWFKCFNSDRTYFDECTQQNSHSLIEYNLNVTWKDNCFMPLLKMELKTSNKSIFLSCRKRKAMMQGWMAKQHERRARHEEHIIDLTVNGANFTSSISHHQ
jgi:hypothetical protein